MTWSQICTFVLSAMTVLLTPTPTVAADRHLMSVDAMMKLEGFGAAAIDPNGRWLIFERLRPYEQSDDFSFRTYAMGRSGHQLWRYDLREGAAPKLLPGLEPAPHSYLQGISESGRFLAVMQYRFGMLSLGAYDMEQEKAVRFSQTPAFSQDGAHNPVWISDDELMFAALPDGELPEFTSIRAHTGRTLAKAWEDAWRGNVVTANEVRTSPEDQSDQQEPGRLVRANARSGETEIVAEGLYADLRVSPDQRYLAALAVSKPRPIDPKKLVEDDPRRYRLTVFDLGTGEARLLAPHLEFFPYTIAWAPDGERVAVYGWTAGQTPRSGRFYVVDVKAGTAIRYEHTGLDLVDERERGSFSRPERTVFLGNKLAVFARSIPESEDQTPRFTYREIRPTSLSAPNWYALSADGSSMNLTSELPVVSSVPVHAGYEHLTVAANDGVYRLYLNGDRRRLTSPSLSSFRFLSIGTFATRSGIIRPDFTDEASFVVNDDGAAKIVMVDLRDDHEGETLVVEAPASDATPLAGLIAAGVQLFRVERGPVSRLLVAKADIEGSTHEIARINTHLASIDFGTWKVVSYEVKDPEGKRPSQMIESCVLLPPGYTSSAPPPLIVEVYPGAGPTCTNGGPKVDMGSLGWSPYLWAGRGYAYARLTAPNSSLMTEDGPIAGMPRVVRSGIKALVENSFADPDKMAVVGFSQGGVSALYVASQSSQFKAVVAMNSWADLFSHYFGPNGVYSYTYGMGFGNYGRYDRSIGSSFGIGRSPFEDPEVYYNNSPVFLAPKINAPILLIHSDMDNFSMSQFDEMYGALRRAGKDARYVRYWGEGHGPSSPANIRDLWERIDTFLTDSGLMVSEPQPHTSEISVSVPREP